MYLEFVDKNAWKEHFSETLMSLVFDMPDFHLIESVDYAVLIKDEDDILGFSTCRALDKSHIYMQYGGSLQKSFKNLSSYLLLVNTLKKEYSTITTYIENTNTSMLKIAMKAGFRIIGLRSFKNKIYLEHCIEV